jgi:hypothetical protein
MSMTLATVRRVAALAFLAVSTGAAGAAAQPVPDPPPAPQPDAEPEPEPAPEPGPAPEPPGPSEEVLALERRIAELEARQRDWEARWQAEHDKQKPEAAKPEPGVEAEPKPDAVIVEAVAGKGITVKTANERFAVNLKSRFQVRDTIAHEDDETENEIQIRTLRFTLSGNVLDKDLRYLLQLAFGGNDFEKDSPSPIFDAFVEYVGIRDLNLRVGQFFVPFDRARTIRESALQLVDRPQLVRELTLDRDVGLMLSSSDLFGTGVLGYHLFVGGGEGKNRFGGSELGPLAVARVVVRPWGTFDDDIEGDLGRKPEPHLALGVAGAYNHHTNRVNSTYGTTLALGTADYFHGAADVVFKHSGFALLGEGVLRHAREDFIDGEIDGEPAREWTRSGYGYLVQASMMLNDYLELVGRWEHLFAWGDTDPTLQKLAETQGRQAGGGFNVYFNGHAFKVQADYHYGFGEDTSDTRHVARVALDATF